MWKIMYTDYSQKDIDNLDGSQKTQVLKAISKVAQNPLAKSEGGYGNPLGNKKGNNLTGFFKIKLLKLGLRVVYRTIKENNIMKIEVISIRNDNEVYRIAKVRNPDLM